MIIRIVLWVLFGFAAFSLFVYGFTGLPLWAPVDKPTRAFILTAFHFFSIVAAPFYEVVHHP